MPIKMVMESTDQRVHMNITANQCPGCPENLATRLVMQTVFDHLKDEDPIIFGQGCGIGRDFLQRSGLGTHDSGIVGMLTAMEIRGIDRPIVVIDGDGQVDLGSGRPGDRVPAGLQVPPHRLRQPGPRRQWQPRHRLHPTPGPHRRPSLRASCATPSTSR